MRRENVLTALILLGLIGGVALGQSLFVAAQQSGEPVSDSWRLAGQLVLVRPLMLLIMPLILVSVVVGVTSIGDASRLGLVGGGTLLYFITTMLLAVVLGAFLVSWIGPGKGLPPEQVQALTTDASRAAGQVDALREAVTEEETGRQEASVEGSGPAAQDAGREGSVGPPREATKGATKDSARRRFGLGPAWMNIVDQMLPSNVFGELVAGRPLGVITFGILLGLALALGGETTAPAVRVAEGLFDALMRLVGWVIWLTPLGVFFLVTHAVGKVGFDSLKGPLGKYMMVVFLGLLAHATIVLPVVLAVFGGGNPYRSLWRARRAIMTAFGTSSSSATMPVTLDVATTELGCSRRASNFVIPLGTTVNMDGTALYEAVAVVFLFQLYGIDLGFSDLLIVVITATLAAIGAAGIPSAGLVTMVIVITAVNTSLAGRGVPALPIAAIGIVLGVDRILDMCRTAVNVWGDMVGARIVTRLAPD
ncbi:MAG: dicarboxylate/amino acid:cation symporter [Phycisphaerales bacterium]|nr:dicarboxylate/amino acid:cation symporter [Phycisphaerales bacterium]